MIGYLLRRLTVSVTLAVGLSMLIFLILHFIFPLPGQAALGLQAKAVQITAWNRRHGFMAPVVVQYWRYVRNLLHGNLGYSYVLNQPVSSLLARLGARSLYLSGISLLLALMVTIPLGIFQAVRRDGLFDRVATWLELVLYSAPPFVIYLIALQLLAFNMPLFGYEASQSSSPLTVLADWRDMALPVGCLALTIVAALSRYMRSAAIDTLAHDFIKAVRAKGLPERLVLSRHLLRNACLPMITLLGLAVPGLVTGNLVVEYVFNYKGTGQLFVLSLNREDYPVLIAYTLIVGILTILGNLVADVTLTLADPRLRLTSAP
jgi:peptide/nickel transport system permease protein